MNEFERLRKSRINRNQYEANFIPIHRLSLESGWIRALKPAFPTYLVLRSYLNRRPDTTYCEPYLAKLYQKGFIVASQTLGKMSKLTGWSPPQICQHLKHLEQIGVIEKFPIPWGKPGREQNIYILGVNLKEDIYHCVDCIFFDWYSGLYGNEFSKTPREVQIRILKGDSVFEWLDKKWEENFEQLVAEFTILKTKQLS